MLFFILVYNDMLGFFARQKYRGGLSVKGSHAFIDFIKRYRSLYKSGAYLKKTLLSYLVIAVIIFSLFAQAVIAIINKSYNDNLIQINRNALEQESVVSSAILKNLYDFFYSQFESNSDLIDLMYNPRYDAESSVKSNLVIKELMSYNSLVKSCYIVNFSGKYVCSSCDSCKSFQNFFDPGIVTLIQNKKNGTPLIYVPRKVPATSVPKRDAESLLSLVFGDKEGGALVVNIDQMSFMNMVNQGQQSADLHTVILNSYGDVISSPLQNAGESLKAISGYGQDWSRSNLYRTLQTRQDDAGSFEYSLNGSKQIVTYRRGGDYNFVFITLTTLHLFDKKNIPLVNTSFCFILFIVLCVFVSLIFSWLQYQPVLKLQDNVSKYEPGAAEKTSDEFSYLTKSFEQMHKQCGDLNKGYRDILKFQKSKQLRKILTSGTLAASATQSAFERLNIMLNGPYLAVCILQIDCCGSSGFPDENDVSLMQYALMNISMELLEKDFYPEYVETGGKECTFIVNLEEEGLERLSIVLTKISKVITQYLEFEISCGVGSSVNTVEDIARSFNEARAALFYRSQNQPVCCYADLRFIDREKQAYPAETEKKLIDSLKGPSKKQFSETLDSFFDLIGHYNHDKVLFSVLKLMTEIEKAEIACGVSDSDLMYFDSLFSTQRPLSAFRQDIRGRCLQFMDLYAEIKSNRNDRNELIVRVKEIVAKNLQDEGLSVKGIARQIHISVNYLRSIFKEGTGESLSSYINEMKLSKICIMLSESTQPVGQISDQFGFASRNYFHVFFKKHVGMTPEQYRRTHWKAM